MCKTMNDPSFRFENRSQQYSREEQRSPRVENRSQQYGRQEPRFPRPYPRSVTTKKTEVQTTEVQQSGESCPVHQGSAHDLDHCREFRSMTLPERKLFLRENNICYKCCKSTAHIAKDCTSKVRCHFCRSDRHTTALHVFHRQHREPREAGSNTDEKKQPSDPHGGELRSKPNVKCTEVCGEGFSGRSCAKTVLVNVYPEDSPERCIQVYAILDDQSNCTLATSDLLDSLGVQGKETQYELASCSGLHQSSGRKVHALNVQSTDKSYELQLQTVFECNNIPQDQSEIPTPEVAEHFPHLSSIADHIPPLASEAKISLLIGRDTIEAHQVQEQITGPRGSPFAQRLGFGWVIIGDVCLGKVHKPTASEIRITTFKTYMVDEDRASIFPPCPSNLKLKEFEDDNSASHHDSLFGRTRDDEKPGLSIEDRTFLEIMNKEVKKTEKGRWIAPLPFRSPKPTLPNNRQMALKRALILDSNLKKNPDKRDHFVTFMEKVISSGAAEMAPKVQEGQEVWYFPIFGVYNPHKPGKLRGVFDSSASFKGISLNETLLSGPNLTNSLLGILLRFRQDCFAIAADIEQMFYAFLVREDHRDFLRFFWYQDNNPNSEIVEYQMTAHVFGNSPSPAVATYCLRKSVENVDLYGQDVKEFVENNFYVDDGLKSVTTETEAVSLLQRTQKALQEEGKIRLHKVVSNSPEILKAFPEEDLGKGVESLNLNKDLDTTHQSLGLSWDLYTDCFKFSIQLPEKPDTRRGMLSTLNSVYDPLGFVAPIVIPGKILLREVTKGADWDEKLEPHLVQRWKSWTDALQSLETLMVPRMFTDQSLTTTKDAELHVFSDASEKAISAVAYVSMQGDSDKNIGFVMGKVKVAPAHGNTIPRLELCAALLATQLKEVVVENLDVEFKMVQFYTDSKVVLGYLKNKTRRFYNYVSNRVSQILHVSRPEQWRFVRTQENPADCGTRGLSSTAQLVEKWLTPPRQLLCNPQKNATEDFALVLPEEDKEIRVEVKKTGVKAVIADRFRRFSDWNRLVTSVNILKEAARRKKNVAEEETSSQSIREETERFIVQTEQYSAYPEEIQSLRKGDQIPRKSPLVSLRPYLDKFGIMRVGGRLNKGCLPVEETNPIILPGRSHVGLLLARLCHENTRHQGRLLTEAAIRNKGYWLVGAKRLVSRLIHECVKCRKLRGTVSQQVMADLPQDRLTPGPPFTFVGLDTFGPWSIVTRKTRGGAASSKRWAILFTCLTTRAVHIEVVEEMSSSSFINALRRFIALRGNVKQFRSDRGTNFVGATDSLQINTVNVEDGPVKKYLYETGVTWLFNPPHSSHMGGVWERMIGLVRRILDGMLQNNLGRNLTHEVLVTFMAEASAIINSRPVAPLSTDPESPEVLSPAVLLNQRIGGEPTICHDFSLKDMYRSHWKQVQVLSDIFWKRWRESFLQTLQKRRIWTTEEPNIKKGDVILLKDKDVPRSDWRVGVVTNAIPSDGDGKVRKAEVRVVAKNGSTADYVRPITELILLLSD